MTVTNPVSARVTRRFRTSAEDVFDAWLNPELARQWFAPGLGEMARVEIDRRVGGTFWLVQRRGAEEAQHTGEDGRVDPTPSADDMALTRRLVDAGQLIGVDVLDHIVIGDGRYVSFRERGWL